MPAVDTRGRNVSSQTNGLLSPLPESHSRSGSPTPSSRSDRSAVTVVENNSEFEGRKAKFQRRGTQLVTVKIKSRWDCLMGLLFGPDKTEQRIKATVKEPETEYDYGEAFDHSDCAFVKTLSVLSHTEDKQVVNARCAFDTLCLQGNIVSLAFATKLGYKEAEFRKLKPREQHGGVSASGHAILPKGAIYLSWYHSTSPQYSNMRFLVVDDAQYDLLIGTESIVRHKLISPPNLVHNAGVTVISQGDKEAERLQAEEMRCKTQFEDHKRERTRRQRRNIKRPDLDAETDESKRLYDIARLKNTEYLTIRSLNADPSDKGKEEYLKQIQAEIKNVQREKDESETDGAKVNGSGKFEPEKDKEIVAPGKTSDTTLQPNGPDGKIQAPTGVSLTDESGEVRQRK